MRFGGRLEGGGGREGGRGSKVLTADVDQNLLDFFRFIFTQCLSLAFDPILFSFLCCFGLFFFIPVLIFFFLSSSLYLFSLVSSSISIFLLSLPFLSFSLSFLTPSSTNVSM